MKTNVMIVMGIVAMTACTSNQKKPTAEATSWGMVEGKEVQLYTLSNSNGISAKVSNYGGIIVEYNTPDKDGKLANIVLGLGSLDDYLAGHPSLGCIVGRYANRIGGAKFTLDGTEYLLEANSGKHHIHGGTRRFGDKVWDATTATDDNAAVLHLTCRSVDMESGYPGNMTVRVDYVLNNDDELQICYTAETDKATVVNLTNHCYFNLTGCKEDVREHQVKLYADEYTPVDGDNIPTGEIARVEGTPFDLREWTTISSRLPDLPRGYDNNFCVKGRPGQPVLAAELYDPESRRLLQTYTTEPGVQFYTSCNLDGSKKGPQGAVYSPFMGACFEAQHYPDSPNKAAFPSTVLRPGDTYTQVTIYKAGIK